MTCCAPAWSMSNAPAASPAASRTTSMSTARNPMRLFFFEREWADEAALRTHFAVEGSKAFVKSLKGRIVETFQRDQDLSGRADPEIGRAASISPVEGHGSLEQGTHIQSSAQNLFPIQPNAAATAKKIQRGRDQFVDVDGRRRSADRSGVPLVRPRRFRCRRAAPARSRSKGAKQHHGKR